MSPGVYFSVIYSFLSQLLDPCGAVGVRQSPRNERQNAPRASHRIYAIPGAVQEYVSNLLNAFTSMYKSSGSAGVFELIDRTPIGNNKGSHVVTPFWAQGAARCSLVILRGLKGSVERFGFKSGTWRVYCLSRRQRKASPPCSIATTLLRAPNGCRGAGRRGRQFGVSRVAAQGDGVRWTGARPVLGHGAREHNTVGGWRILSGTRTGGGAPSRSEVPSPRSVRGGRDTAPGGGGGLSRFLPWRRVGSSTRVTPAVSCRSMTWTSRRCGNQGFAREPLRPRPRMTRNLSQLRRRGQRGCPRSC